jgi:hypothetical protein
MRAALTASAALLVTLISCSDRPSQITTVVFDGQTYEIDGPVSCVDTLDGELVINASSSSITGGKKLVRVVLAQEDQLVVEAAGFRFLDVQGFTDDPNEAWATKGDDTYTISGRMPPDIGATAWRQFKIDVTCREIETRVVRPPTIGRVPPRWNYP